jgi:thioredoxin reductase
MDSTMIHFRSMFQEYWQAIPTFHGICDVTVTGITAQGVSYRDKDGGEHLIPADNVVVSTGMRSKRDEALSFYNITDGFYMIGDCVKPGTIQQAMRTAFATASQI